jgi:general secretion pathway protein J
VKGGATHRTTRGFTLIEVLVVLVIVGMVSTLLMEAIFYTGNLRNRLGQRIDEVRRLELAHQWFGDSVQGLTAFPPEVVPPFQGTATRFSGLTRMGITATPGRLVRIRWEIKANQGDAVLGYQEGEKESGRFLPVLRFDLQEQDVQGFSYLGPEGRFHPRWPPSGEPGVQQLPVAVRAVFSSSTGTRVWLQRIGGRRTPRTPYDLR